MQQIYAFNQRQRLQKYELNGNLVTVTTECAIAVGEAECREEVGKLTKKTKELLAKELKLSGTVYQIILVERLKLINRSKAKDIHAYNVAVIEEAPKIGGSLKEIKRKLAMGKDRMYALRDEQGNITHSTGEVMNVVG